MENKCGRVRRTIKPKKNEGEDFRAQQQSNGSGIKKFENFVLSTKKKDSNDIMSKIFHMEGLVEG